MRVSWTLLSLVVAVGWWTRPVDAGLGKECYSNSDCPDGTSCVAGDSVNAVQRCVAGMACSGASKGNCPGDESSGQLACIWRPNEEACEKAPAGCKEIEGKLGIYKCISMTRCDAYFDGSCSNACNVDGKQCNGRGSCQLESESVTSPKFSCACETGWNGTRCNNVLDDKCITDVGQCGEHGTCKDNKCECKNDYTGVQCEIAPKSSSSGSKGAGAVETQKPASSTASPTKTDSANETKSKGKPTLAILLGVLAVVILVSTIIFVVFAKKKRQQDAAAAGFQRSGSVDSLPASLAGPPTPKQRIVVM